MHVDATGQKFNYSTPGWLISACMVSEVSPGETRTSERVLNNGSGSSLTCQVPGLR